MDGFILSLSESLPQIWFPLLRLVTALFFLSTKRAQSSTSPDPECPAHSFQLESDGFGSDKDIDVGTCLASCRYDPSTGIYGMDFYVVLERPGYRVGRRRRAKSRVGIQHRVTKEDAMKWFQVKYEGVILNKSNAIA